MNEKDSIHHEGDARILSDEERRSFQGMTINEVGQEDSGHHEYKQQQIPFMKVYTWQSFSLWQKLALGLIGLAILALLFFFGGMLLIGFGIVAVVAAVVSFLRKII